jgi:eukaryotic-like serine/threonine-protein kinase
MHAMAGTGRVIAGRYRLKETIGRGAMGTVWRGWDEILDREIAVKELRISDSLPEEERAKAYQRTHREARTAARLSHPGLVTVFDVAEEDGRPWIVMELVHARSLDQIIVEDGPLSPPRAAEAGRQLLSALATAHAAGVLHRDVKPSNVLLTDAGRAVLTDFGIATFQGDPRLTQTGMVMGSPGFTAPERIQGNSATPGSDLWSLGATLYAALEGHGPFDQAGGAITTMSAIINTDPPTAPIAAGLGRVIDGLLRRNPAERPDAATAARMLGAIVPLPEGSMGPSGFGGARGGAAAGGFGAAEGLGVAGALGAAGLGAGGVAGAIGANGDFGAGGVRGAGADGGFGAGGDRGAGADGGFGARGDRGAGADGGLGADGGAGAVGVIGAADAGGAEALRGIGAAGAGGATAVGGTAVDLPAREEPSAAAHGAEAPTTAAAAPAPPQSASAKAAPSGWATPLAAGATAWPTAAPEGDRPGQTAAVPPQPGTLAVDTASPGGPGSPGGPADPGGPRRRPARRTALIVAGVVILLIATAAGVFLARSHGRNNAADQSNTSPSNPVAQARTPTTAAAGPASTGPLPSGWRWYSVSASTTGTNAGFKLAIPDGWQAYPKGDGALFEAPGGDSFLQVDLTPHTKSSMVAEAYYLARLTQQQGKFPGYANQRIRATNIRGYSGAAWSFTWQDPTLGQVRALDLMYIARTSAYQQSYALYLSSPDPAYDGNLATFTEEMRTFRSAP